jgi:CheY-like chemotaxis protein
MVQHRRGTAGQQRRGNRAQKRHGRAGHRATAPPQQAATGDPPLEILLVEDCASDEILTMIEFRRNGLAEAIRVVRDGAEALDFFARRGRYAQRARAYPGLVLLDLRLPKVSGLEVLRHLKSDPAARGVRVVALLSSEDDENLAELHRLGVDGVLVKPVRFERFVELALRFDMRKAIPSTIRS